MIASSDFGESSLARSSWTIVKILKNKTPSKLSDSLEVLIFRHKNFRGLESIDSFLYEYFVRRYSEVWWNTKYHITSSAMSSEGRESQAKKIMDKKLNNHLLQSDKNIHLRRCRLWEDRNAEFGPRSNFEFISLLTVFTILVPLPAAASW